MNQRKRMEENEMFFERITKSLRRCSKQTRTHPFERRNKDFIYAVVKINMASVQDILQEPMFKKYRLKVLLMIEEYAKYICV